MTKVEDIQPNLEDIDMWILKEAAGCSIDDEKAQIWSYDYANCILYASALARKILGIFGVPIGNDPRRAGGSLARDWDRDKALIANDPNRSEAMRAAELDALQHEHAFASKLSTEFNQEAWTKLIELEQIIMRRAFALERAKLVETNVDGLMPDEVIAKFKSEGHEASSPATGTIEITSRGLRCVGALVWPRKKDHQKPGTERWDYDVEVDFPS